MSEKSQEESKSENNDLPVPVETKPAKKPRKPFEWTEKRLEAFKKMREGLVAKNEITKKIQEEKSKSEKEEIKKRVREIMNLSKVSKEVEKEQEEDPNTEESESETEQEKEIKKKSSKSSTKKEKKEKKPQKRVKEVVVESESEEELSENSTDSEEERVVLNAKQHYRAQKSKASRGKVAKQSTYYKPMDRFILL